MNVQDPYQPPRSSDYADLPAGVSSGEVPAEAVDALRETRPWVTLLAVMGFIGAGFTILIGLGMLVMGKRTDNLPPQLGLVYILLAGLYLLPAVLLIRYSSSIGRLLQGAGATGLVDALRSQRSFWRAMGIMTLVFIALMMLAFVVGIGAAFLIKR